MLNISLDKKSLGLARVLLGILLIFYFCETISETSDFYAPQSALSFSEVLQKFPEARTPSFFFFTPNEFTLKVIFSMGVVASVAIVFGFFARWFLFLAWLLILNIYLRNPILLYGGDQILKLTLLWFTLLPCNEAFTLFPGKSEQDLTDKRWSGNLLSFSWCLQIFIMYEMSLFYKLSHPEWTQTFNSLYYVLNADYLIKPLGKFILSLGIETSRLMAILTMIFEGIGPFFIFFFSQRLLLICLFLVFHFFIWLSIDVGFFSHLCAIWWFTLIPKEFWTKHSWAEKFSSLHYKTIGFDLPKRVRFLISQLSALFAGVMIVTIVILSIDQMAKHQLLGRSSPVTTFANTIQINQYWAMFTNKPPLSYDGWFVSVGLRKNQHPIDVLTRSTPSFDKPSSFTAIYPTIHWRTYTRKYRSHWPLSFNENFSLFLCNKWNNGQQKAEDKITSIKIYFMNETTPPPGGVFAVNQELLIDRPCPF